MTATTTYRVDGAVYSLAIKSPCVAVSNANLTLSGEQTVNSVAVVEEDRVLVKNQTDATENGIYVVETGAWGRAKDFDGNRDIVDGTLVTVAKTTGMNFFYQVDATDPIVIGTSEIAFLLASDPNVSFPIVAAEIAAGLTTSDISDSWDVGDSWRYGLVGDGSTDDTAAWVNWLSFSGRKRLYKPASKYKIDSHAFAVSSLTIFIEPGTVVETNSGYGASESMFAFAGRGGIIFEAYGATFQFDSKPASGEQRHIFRIQDCSDIFILGATAKDSGGDGFYLGLRDAPAERIYITDCVSDNNRRNGVSVTSGRDVFFTNHLSKNTTGTSPQAGYDVEPNEDDVSSGQTEGPLENINFVNCRSLDNVGNGFQYAGGSDLTQIGPFSISFDNCVSRGDAINFEVNAGDPSGTQEGIIEFSGCHGFDADGNGISIKGSNMPVIWRGGMIMNPNQASNGDNRNGSAVSIFSVSGTDGQDIGNVSIKGLKVRDPDGNMLKTVTMQLVSEGTSTISDVDIEIDAKGVATNKRSFEGGSRAVAPVSIKYTDQPSYSQTADTGSSTTPTYANQKIDNTGAVAQKNFQINTSASQYIGNHYEFEITVAQNLVITTSAGEEHLPDNATTLTSNTIGSKLRIEWDGGNWQVTQNIGTWT